MPEDSVDQKVTYLNRLLYDSTMKAMPYMERKEFIQKLYDGDIADMLPTLSDTVIPILRTATQSALADAIPYMFPQTGLVSLQPAEAGMSYDSVRKLEDAVDDMIIHKMQAERKALPIIQDALKFGCGYGIVENKQTVVSRSNVYSVISDKEEVVTKELVPEVKVIPSLRYIPYECVIPTPDCSDTENGTCVMFVDYMSEHDFRSLYLANTTKDKIYKGSPDEIIDDAKSAGISGGLYPHFFNILTMCGETTNNTYYKLKQMVDMQNSGGGDNPYTPVMIPVVKYFFKGEHIWVVNGTEIIYESKDTFETLRCPVLRAAPNIDSNNWWVLSDIAASKDMALAANSYSNAILDMLTLHIRPPIAYDRLKWDGSEPPKYEPWGSIAVTGRVDDAFKVVAPPPIASGLMGFGDAIEGKYRQMNGDPLNGQASAGMVRGGNNSFESLLQTETGRRELAGVVMDMNFIEPLIQNTIICMQTLPTEEYEYVQLKDRNYVNERITLDEMRYEFDVTIDLKKKARTSQAEDMSRMSMYVQTMANNPRIRQVEAFSWMIGDQEASRTLIASDEEYKKNVEAMQKAQQPQQAQQGQTQGEQAQAGREASR